jgi:hypothetical protein
LQFTAKTFERIRTGFAAPSEKALGREKGGACLGQSSCRPTIEQARQRGVDFCQWMKLTCEIIMENNRGLASEL